MMTWSRKLPGALLPACFLFFALVTAISELVPVGPRQAPAGLAEDWKPQLASVKTVDDAVRILPAYFEREQGSREARIAAGIDRFVRDRFYHGPSLLNYRHNWIAAAAGAFWINLRMPVLPDEILHHRRAICSQQAIVFMALLERYRIDYASVLMNWPARGAGDEGHFAVAARIDGRWLYFDPDQEAAQVGVPVESVMDGSALPRLYAGKPALLGAMLYAAAHQQIRLAHVDVYPAPRGGLFQQVTRWFSAYGWLLFGLLTLAQLAVRHRRRGEVRAPVFLPA
jgi:hypothetical protein